MPVQTLQCDFTQFWLQIDQLIRTKNMKRKSNASFIWQSGHEYFSILQTIVLL